MVDLNGNLGFFMALLWFFSLFVLLWLSNIGILKIYVYLLLNFSFICKNNFYQDMNNSFILSGGELMPKICVQKFYYII